MLTDHPSINLTTDVSDRLLPPWVSAEALDSGGVGLWVHNVSQQPAMLTPHEALHLAEQLIASARVAHDAATTTPDRG